MTIIFGIDTEKDTPTPIDVRDALILCFKTAHQEDAKQSMGNVELGDEYFTQIIKKAFSQTDGDFKNPTKESIQAAMKNLVGFAEHFRDKSIIESHYAMMMKLTALL